MLGQQDTTLTVSWAWEKLTISFIPVGPEKLNLPVAINKQQREATIHCFWTRMKKCGLVGEILMVNWLWSISLWPNQNKPEFCQGLPPIQAICAGYNFSPFVDVDGECGSVEWQNYRMDWKESNVHNMWLTMSTWTQKDKSGLLVGILKGNWDLELPSLRLVTSKFTCKS